MLRLLLTGLVRRELNNRTSKLALFRRLCVGGKGFVAWATIPFRRLDPTKNTGVFIPHYLIPGALAFLCIVSTSGLRAQTLPEDFYDEKYLGPLDFPTGITFDQNGRMYIWEKAGRVYIADSTGAIFPEPLIDISEEVSNWNDHGLMGFALDREFLTNGYFYLLYALDLHHYDHYGTPEYHPDSTIVAQPTIGRITRYKADPLSNFTRVLPGSRKVLLGETIGNSIPILYEFHGLGGLAVAEDGSLLASAGDATSNAGADLGGDSLGTMASAAIARGIISADQDIGSYRSQYLANYNGKILRIDPETGDGLPGNPFFDPARPRSPQSRIWAWGLRNPYRFIVRPNSGSHYIEDGRPGILYVGDVGNGSWEELNIVEFGGQNFGWPIMEGHGGNFPTFLLEAPPNQLAPNPLYGEGCAQEYFTFKDLYSNLTVEGGRPPANPCDSAIAIENYVVGYPPAILWSNARWNPPARAIIPFFNDRGEINGAELGTPQAGVSGENFAGFSSLSGVFYTGNLYPEKYRGKFFAYDFSGWIQLMDFDENHKLRAVEKFHNFTKDIIHLALNPADGMLYYINLQGEVRRISFGGNPPPVAVIEADQYYGPSPLEVRFDGSRSFDSNLPIVSYYWDFGDGQSSAEQAPRHTFTSAGAGPQSFQVELTVADSLGASSSARAIVSLNNTPPKVEITSFADGSLYPVNQGTTLLRLAAEVSDKEHSDEQLTYEWRVFIHHNLHFHPNPVIFGHEAFTLISPLGCDDEEYWYRIELTVTDPEGLSTRRTHRLYPYCGEPFVEWTELRGKAEIRLVSLKWQTLFEDSIARFELQRSPDYFQFQLLDTLPAKGKPGASNYVLYDLEPLIGRNIYRVKAVKENGAYLFSNLAVVDYPVEGKFGVFPNPAGPAFKVRMKKAWGEQVRFELFNNMGQVVFQHTWPAEAGQVFEQWVPTGKLANGVYHYRLANGELEGVGSLMIAK